MKNITVLTVLVIIASIFFLTAPLYSQNQFEKEYIFSLGTGFGFVYGQSFEIVYPVNTPAKYLSELSWDMAPVLYAGLQADFLQVNAVRKADIFTSLTFNVGLPFESGSIENRDWLDQHSDALTDFSKHTNKTREFYWLDAAFGVSIPVINLFYIKPFFSGSWMRFAFTGKDGYGEYAGLNPPSISYDGKEVLRYEQNWLIAAAGLSIGAKIASVLNLELSFQMSPLIYCMARDDHLPVYIAEFNNTTNHRIYKDYMGFGMFIEPKAKVSLVMKNSDLSFDVAYRYIGGTTGITYINEGNMSTNASGSGLSVLNTRFIARFSF